MVLVFRDVTEHKRAEEALRFLAQASTVLASSLDYQATLDRVAQLAVPWLADWALVDMVEPDGSTRLLALTHQDPAKVEFAPGTAAAISLGRRRSGRRQPRHPHRSAGAIPGNPGCDPGGPWPAMPSTWRRCANWASSPAFACR